LSPPRRSPRSQIPDAPLSPDAALRLLLAGNKRFAANRLRSVADDLAILKAKTVQKQEPFAAVLSCADSRVPVELVFDQTIGQIFVARIAGNIATPEVVASLEYGVAILGVKVLLVLGHTSCGAVTAAMTTADPPGQIRVLYHRLQPAVERSRGLLRNAVEINAALQAEMLRGSSSVIRDAVHAGRLKVASGVYDLATGRVRLHRRR
jgi:carbonic anhydrase